MKSHFSSSFFKANRRRLRELMTSTAPIVMTANGLLQRGADISFVFAQDANFWYLTGIDEADIVVVIDQDDEYLIIPERTISRQAFEGSIDSQELQTRSGIPVCYSQEEGWEKLRRRIKRVRHVATVVAPEPYISQFGLFTNPARAVLGQRLLAINKNLELLDLSSHLARMRTVKQPPELAAIEQAIQITADSLSDALRPPRLRNYQHEYQLEAAISAGFRERGASGNGFEPVVASGARACTLHYTANNRPLEPNSLVVLDVGAEVEHYAADISRTIVIGRATKRQKNVHQAIQEIQNFAIDLLKPGVLMRQYEAQVERFMGEKFRNLGLIKTIDSAAIRELCPQAFSHFLGLNVHDVGDYRLPLEPGAVLTVEPGVYIKAEAIGVRIEDDVLITETGHKVLSSGLPRTLG